MRFAFRDTVPAQLLRFWFRPRLVGWALLAAAAMLLSRLPFHGWPVIPNYLGFAPGVVLVPLAGIFWGPGGAWAALGFALADDALAGWWGPLTPYRAAGLVASALTAQHLWDFRLFDTEGGPIHLPHWGRSLRFLAVAWPAVLPAAAWPALGAERLGLYPFPYYFGLLAAQSLLFVTLFGVVFYRVLARELIAHARTWKELMHAGPAATGLGRGQGLLVLAAAIAAPAAGLALGRPPEGTALLDARLLGETSAPGVARAVGALLVLHAAALLARYRRLQA